MAIMIELTRSGYIIVIHPETGEEHSRHYQEREAVESATNLAAELGRDVTIRYDQTVLVSVTSEEEPSEPTPTEPPEADYYIATDGSDANAGTFDAPFATIGKAASVVQPGDRVLIRGGTYKEQVKLTISGTEGNPITFAGYPGETVILDAFTGSYDPDETGRDQVFGWEVDASWNVLQVLTITNANYIGLYVRQTNNTLQRITSHTNRYHGFQISGQDHLLEDCYAYDNQQPNGGFRSDRGETQQSADGFAFSGTGHIARRCVGRHNADDGFDAWGASGITMEACVAFDNGYDDGNGNGFKGPNEANSATTVRRCVSFNNLRRGYTNNGGHPHTFHNCTAFQNGQVGFQNIDAPGNEFRNNLSHGHGEDDFQVWSGGEPDHTHNTWNLGITVSCVLSTDRTDPNYLALAAGGLCIDAGTDVGLPYAGAAPDLGALQEGETIESLLGRPLEGVNA